MKQNNQLDLAKDIFDYLYMVSEPIQPIEVIIGFGHFDLKIPQQCGNIFEEQLEIFSGKGFDFIKLR